MVWIPEETSRAIASIRREKELEQREWRTCCLDAETSSLTNKDPNLDLYRPEWEDILREHLVTLRTFVKEACGKSTKSSLPPWTADERAKLLRLLWLARAQGIRVDFDDEQILPSTMALSPSNEPLESSSLLLLGNR